MTAACVMHTPRRLLPTQVHADARLHLNLRHHFPLFNHPHASNSAVVGPLVGATVGDLVGAAVMDAVVTHCLVLPPSQVHSAFFWHFLGRRRRAPHVPYSSVLGAEVGNTVGAGVGLAVFNWHGV